MTKISVITAVFNGVTTIEDTILSVANQTHSDVEHIVVDGASTDGTQEIINRHRDKLTKVISETDGGVYHAMNKGLSIASGEVVGFLNADDVYMHPDVLARVAETMADPAIDACYANLVYVDRRQSSRVVRHWISQDYAPGMFEKGWMPAHPTFYVRKSVYEMFGGFDLRYRLQSDFDLALRFMGIHGIKTRYIKEDWVRMRMGGMSNNSIRNMIRGNIEAYSACRNSGLNITSWFILTKVLSRVPQFFRARRMKRVDHSVLIDAVLPTTSNAQVRRDADIRDQPSKTKKLCFVTTIPEVVTSFLQNHITASAAKWTVTVVTNSEGAEFLNGTNATFIPLPIERKIFIWRDLRTLVKLIILFRRERFDLVHSIMPKAGLLAMLAGRFAMVPNRIHTFTGQVWATKRGWRRKVLKYFDRLIVQQATRVFVDSPSQRDFLLAEGVLPAGKGEVIGHGSICGVNAERFRPNREVRETIRRELNISDDAIVVIFLGRINRDKGVLDLAVAFKSLAAKRQNIDLLLVGAEEDVAYTTLREICGTSAMQLHHVNYTPSPERYMAAADVLCLPSYREGFGQVIIEAAATGLPSVCSRIYGITDALVNGRTGLLFPPGDINALTVALERMLGDTSLRLKMGRAARERVQSLFTSHDITQKLLGHYEETLASHE